MTIIEDVKFYKQNIPEYQNWKTKRDSSEAAKISYLLKNPDSLNVRDIQRGKTLLRAIDTLDEYTQSNAEDMEVATSQIIGVGLQGAGAAGGFLGGIIGAQKPIKKIVNKYSPSKLANTVNSGFVGMIVASSLASIPLFSWAYKSETIAARKGRYQAMREDLKDAKKFAILTPAQEEQLRNLIAESNEESSVFFKNPIEELKERYNDAKNLLIDSEEYIAQKEKFEKKIAKDKAKDYTQFSETELDSLKKEQELLTTLVEKIDKGAQDYAENAEIVTNMIFATIAGMSAFLQLGYSKLAQRFNLKLTKMPIYAGALATVLTSVFAANIQKDAARIGRFKVKQDFYKNPEKFGYVDDDKIKNIKNIEKDNSNFTNFFKFITSVFKDAKAYNRWQVEEGRDEKLRNKALEKIELSEEQLKDARRLQFNTFKLFHKIDEKSQKYSEIVESVGQAVRFPIIAISSLIGTSFAPRFLTEAFSDKSKMKSGLFKYFSVVLLSCIPGVLMNAYITREQKNAALVTDMLAIKEFEKLNKQ